MRELFEELQKCGYNVHNKRVLGKPEHTSVETKQKDLIQEYALLGIWLLENYGIWIEVKCPDMPNQLWYYDIHKFQKYGSYGEGENLHSPTEAYEAAIEYTLNKLI